MSGGIAYALAALVCYGIGDLIYKRAAAAGLKPEYFLMVQAWCFCPAILFYAWGTGNLHLEPAALWGCLAGLFVLVGFYNYVRSLRVGAVSIVAPVFRLNFIITAALAILWLSEPLTASKAAGFLLALLAAWLLLGGAAPLGSADPLLARRPLLQVTLATLAVGVANFCYKLGLIAGATPETMLAAQAVVFSSLLTATTFAVNGTIRPARGLFRHSLPAAIVLVAASLFLLHGLQRGDASVVVPIAQMGFVIAAVLGIAFFGETLSLRKIAGLCVATAALAALTLG
ncbi:MAG TPA: EamA family transporter [Stellaceae bacterium]|nr:EamA family transporter [Stellaceae bacterium]